jgi:hypothetical protein
MMRESVKLFSDWKRVTLLVALASLIFPHGLDHLASVIAGWPACHRPSASTPFLIMFTLMRVILAQWQHVNAE